MRLSVTVKKMIKIYHIGKGPMAGKKGEKRDI